MSIIKTKIFVILFSVFCFIGTPVFAAKMVKQYRVYNSAQQTTHPFWLVVYDGMHKANEKYGFNIITGGPPYPNIVEQVQLLDAAIASGEYDAFIIAACEPPYLEKSINRAVDDGKIVVLTCDDVPNSKRHATIRTGDYEAGQKAGELYVQVSGGKGSVAIQTGDLTQLSLNERIKGFKDYIKKNSQIKVEALDTTGVDSTVKKGPEVLAARLIASPNVDGLFIPHGDSGSTYKTTYVDFKDRMDKMTIVGFDDTAQALDVIREGFIDGVVVQSQYSWGYGSVYQLHRILQAGLPPTAEITYCPTVKITKDNVDTIAVATRDPQYWIDFANKE